MKIIKKTIFAALSLTIVLALSFGSANAATYYSNGVFTFSKLGEGNIAINSYDLEEPDVEIPEKIFGDTVTTIAKYAFYQNKNISSVTLPATVSSIGDYAFAQADDLQSLTIPESVKSIGEGVFRESVSLKTIDLTDGVNSGFSSIRAFSFYGCSSLESIELPSSINKIDKFAFANCSALRSVRIPRETVDINPNAFSGCLNLTIFGYSGSFAQQYAEENNIPFEAVTEFQLGDTNLDGKVNITDATQVQKYVADLIAFNYDQKLAADYNQDGEINIVDATCIQRHVAGFTS